MIPSAFSFVGVAHLPGEELFNIDITNEIHNSGPEMKMK